jgi:hypothetical protein
MMEIEVECDMTGGATTFLTKVSSLSTKLSTLISNGLADLISKDLASKGATDADSVPLVPQTVTARVGTSGSTVIVYFVDYEVQSPVVTKDEQLLISARVNSIRIKA